MTQIRNMIVLDQSDNVGVALRNIVTGETALGDEVSVCAGEDIPQGHKIALRDIACGERVVRYGVPVAIVTQPIARGKLVHIHNVRSQYLDNNEDHFE
jgi:altronate dehydratase